MAKKKAKRKKMTKYVEDRIIEGLINGNTLVHTCEVLNIPRMTEWRHRQQKKSYRKRVDAAYETRTEVVEDALFATAISGNVQAQRFFLINRSKPRWKSEFGTAVEDVEGVSIVNVRFGERPKKGE